MYKNGNNDLTSHHFSYIAYHSIYLFALYWIKYWFSDAKILKVSTRWAKIVFFFSRGPYICQIEKTPFLAVFSHFLDKSSRMCFFFARGSYIYRAKKTYPPPRMRFFLRGVLIFAGLRYIHQTVKKLSQRISISAWNTRWFLNFDTCVTRIIENFCNTYWQTACTIWPALFWNHWC